MLVEMAPEGTGGDTLPSLPPIASCRYPAEHICGRRPMHCTELGAHASAPSLLVSGRTGAPGAPSGVIRSEVATSASDSPAVAFAFSSTCAFNSISQSQPTHQRALTAERSSAWRSAVISPRDQPARTLRGPVSQQARRFGSPFQPSTSECRVAPLHGARR
jgi:hypothetical protein